MKLEEEYNDDTETVLVNRILLQSSSISYKQSPVVLFSS